MPQPVNLSKAEQGTIARIPFVVLNVSGSPVQPTSLTVDVLDVATLTSQALLTAVSAGEIGRFYADWDIPAAQAPGFYRAVITPDTGSVDPIAFEVFAAGTFAAQQESAFDAAQAVTDVKRISQAKNEEAFVALVRTILRDHPQLNRLTAGRETSDGEIKIAAAMAISMYNTTPPVFSTESTFTNFPSIAWLVIGTIGWVLNSAWILRQRNNLQYSDGGITVDTENVGGYGQLAQNWWGNYLQWVPQFKVALNLNNAWGNSPTGVHSEYFLLSSLLGDSSYGGAGVLMQ